MNEREQELFEAELCRLKPNRPPEEFMTRLAAAQPLSREEPRSRGRPAPAWAWWRILRRLAPAGAVAATMAVLLVWQPLKPGTKSPGRPVTTVTPRPALNADDVEIARQLVGGFDAVARMPDGEPVRFRCHEWMDNVILRDSTQGVVVEQRTPRLEIVPVRFETY